MRFAGVALAAAAVLMIGGSVQAQTYTSRPIDAEKLVVKPTDTATSIVGNSFKYVSRVTAGYIDNNAMVRTVNALWGTKKYAAPVQGGLSPLPDPSSYPSSYYKSVIQPSYPKYSTFGK